jgi:hypothetical protein
MQFDLSFAAAARCKGLDFPLAMLLPSLLQNPCHNKKNFQNMAEVPIKPMCY